MRCSACRCTRCSTFSWATRGPGHSRRAGRTLRRCPARRRRARAAARLRPPPCPRRPRRGARPQAASQTPRAAASRWTWARPPCALPRPCRTSGT
ncbi:MAG: hypothetical protein EB833_05110 [Thaumarchaeota archaeon S13]|nr:MAG: hypothetical protein EB833_05110 [Thaumarchaeota archaeon S13]